MSKKLHKALSHLPDDSEYKVGKGKPPKEHQWQPGQSGNPSGRPPGSKNKPPPRSELESNLSSIILDEGYRMIPVNDADGPRMMEAVRVNMRALGLLGAKGRHRAARDFVELVTKAEQVKQRDGMEALESALEYKRLWKEVIRPQKRLGISGPKPLPHPDDVIVDVRRDTVHIVGPATQEEKGYWEELRSYLPEFEAELKELEAKRDDPACRNRRKLITEIEQTKTVIAFIRRAKG